MSGVELRETEPKNYADFLVGGDRELPESVKAYLEMHEVPHVITPVIEEDCLRMLTNTGSYAGEESMLRILGVEFPTMVDLSD